MVRNTKMISSSRVINEMVNVPSYDTGWVNCNDWTDQQLGTAVGGNVVHNLGINLKDLDVRVIVSSDGTNGNAIELKDYSRVLAAGDFTFGFSVYQVDDNNITVQTGVNGIALIDTDGSGLSLDTENWYYRIIVISRLGEVVGRDVGGDYSYSEMDTGRKWVDGKTIYRRVWTGTTGAGATSTLALGITIDMLCPGSDLFIDTAGFGWESLAANSGNGPGFYFTNATQNNMTLYHSMAVLQSRPYNLVLEYTKS
jgi:hypothetical protein